MGIKFDHGGLLHKHECDSFSNELIRNRVQKTKEGEPYLDTKVSNGELFADPDGYVWLRTTDAHNKLVGECDGDHHDALLERMENADGMPQVAPPKDEDVVEHDARPLREEARQTGDSSISAKLDTLLTLLLEEREARLAAVQPTPVMTPASQG